MCNLCNIGHTSNLTIKSIKPSSASLRSAILLSCAVLTILTLASAHDSLLTTHDDASLRLAQRILHTFLPALREQRTATSSRQQNHTYHRQAVLGQRSSGSYVSYRVPEPPRSFRGTQGVIGKWLGWVESFASGLFGTDGRSGASSGPSASRIPHGPRSGSEPMAPTPRACHKRTANARHS